MPHDENPELFDWEEAGAPQGSRFFGFFPTLALGVLAGSAFSGGGWNQHQHYGYNFCRPRGYYGYRDYHSCSPRFVCRPAPF